MARLSLTVVVCALMMAMAVPVQAAGSADKTQSAGGDLEIKHVGHGSLMFNHAGKVIHVDPFGKMGDYSKLPKADLVLITHEHGDHLDSVAIEQITKKGTKVIASEAAAKKLKGASTMRNGDVTTVNGLKIEAVPAYNLIHKRESGGPFHPKGKGNGYVITFGDKRVYVAGDTENTPEMKNLKEIDIAFLPANLPYTMTAEMVVDAAKAFKPKVLIPYHYDMGKSELPKLKGLMKDVPGIEFRILEK
jgi:L-ascorbate metabolism protein UlaG (beta-lactamase superfamily)